MVGYVCAAATHFVANGQVDHLTIHEREWAYCPGDVRMGEHEWKATGGSTLTELQSIARASRQRNGQPVADAARPATERRASGARRTRAGPPS